MRKITKASKQNPFIRMFNKVTNIQQQCREGGDKGHFPLPILGSLAGAL